MKERNDGCGAKFNQSTPSSISSFSAETCTSCSIYQSDGVKVRVKLSSQTPSSVALNKAWILGSKFLFKFLVDGTSLSVATAFEVTTKETSSVGSAESRIE